MAEKENKGKGKKSNLEYGMVFTLDKFRGMRTVMVEDEDGVRREHVLIPFLGNGIWKDEKGQTRLKMALIRMRARSTDYSTHLAVPIIDKESITEMKEAGLKSQKCRRPSEIIALVYPWSVYYGRFAAGSKKDKVDGKK
jgi:hypothetical protein